MKKHPFVTETTLRVNRKINISLALLFTFLACVCLVNCFTDPKQFVEHSIGFLASCCFTMFFVLALSNESLNPQK